MNEACKQPRPCVDVEWSWTGAERCNGAFVEREYKSNCNRIDWRIDRELSWVDTGATRCGDTNVEKEQRNDCGGTRWVTSKELVWVDTGATRCKNNLVENKEINDCGETRWTATTEVCGYSPSVPFVIEVFDGCCGGNQVGYMYHPDEPRDPAATVAVEDCNGVVWGYIYPTVATGRTLPVGGCGEAPIGYAVNQSTTAPSFAQCGGDVIVNVPKTTVENTVNVEPTPIEVIVPEPPRSVLSVGWSGDNLLLTYSDGSNQTISTPVC